MSYARMTKDSAAPPDAAGAAPPDEVPVDYVVDVEQIPELVGQQREISLLGDHPGRFFFLDVLFIFVGQVTITQWLTSHQRTYCAMHISEH